jgi:hypothetical protein
MELGAVTDAADGGIAWSARRRARSASYRVIDFKPAKFCSGPIDRLAALAPGCRSARLDRAREAPRMVQRD